MVVWWGTRTECVSALMRQVREGNLTPGGERTARQVLNALRRAWIEIQPGEALRSTAERLLSVHPLRAADAFQLAAANVWRQDLPTEQGLVSLDHRLCNVGYLEGFNVLPEVL